jgi:hypothetical protein
VPVRARFSRYQRTASAITSRGNRYPDGADDTTDLDTITGTVSRATNRHRERNDVLPHLFMLLVGALGVKNLLRAKLVFRRGVDTEQTRCP